MRKYFVLVAIIVVILLLGGADATNSNLGLVRGGVVITCLAIVLLLRVVPDIRAARKARAEKRINDASRRRVKANYCQ